MITSPITPAVRAGLAAIPAPRYEDLLSVSDLQPEDVGRILELALQVKATPADFRGALWGKQLALFFEKPSLRTRLSFEAGMTQLGGTSIFVDQTQSRLGAREPISDMAKNLERWVDALVLRTFAHETVVLMAEHARIPVINALSDLEHPCQALADLMTLLEHFGDLKRVKLAYVGDGNNVAHSLMLAAASVGMDIRVATPPGYEPSPGITAEAARVAAQHGSSVVVTHDPHAAVHGCHAIYTDVWASMGQEDEAEQRKRIFLPYQVNQALFAGADSQAVFLHCLPAHRGEEVAADVIDSPRSLVFDQAENRMHVQKAILLALLGGAMHGFKRGAHA